MIAFDNTYARLPAAFYREVAPSSALRPRLFAFNEALADELGIAWRDIDEDRLAAVFSGREVPDGARPIAQAYAGHQFGHFVSQLGDGRAVLLGETVTDDGRRYDIQLKGAGQTPFSRRGDGRSSLGPVVREYVLSEAMHALGIPTTRALAAATSGDTVLRERALPGGIFTRVAASHIRVGTFEYFASREMHDEVRLLADHVIDRHYPELSDSEDRYVGLFRAVAERTLSLVARWMGVGFIHGVMNTDNTSISGETIDYGPCAFMDEFRFDKAYSSIDHQGRYAYGNQPRIAIWNLSVLANCLVPIVDEDTDEAVRRLVAHLEQFSTVFERRWVETMGAKLGIFEPREGDGELIDLWLGHLQSNRLDFTNSFRDLARDLDGDSPLHRPWRERLEEQDASLDEAVAHMDAHNPVYIPRNHQVERAIQGALDGDLEHFERLNEVLARPYVEQPGAEEFKRPPEPDEVVHQTFCGT